MATTSKPVLMIHNITDEMFELPLENYVLTFDDGTSDHYAYWPKLKQLNTEKIFFVISSLVSTPGYLTVDQLNEMLQDPLTSVGGHSHWHKDIRESSIADQTQQIKTDTLEMLNWFERTLDMSVTKFCYPYNYNPHGLYRHLVSKHGVTEFYGDERIPIETLLHSQPQLDSHDV